MGKKKKKGHVLKKMKEIISSVSIAEIESSSTTTAEILQPQIRRKRGRPRKYQQFGDSTTTDHSKKAKAIEETEEESAEERRDYKEKKLEEIKEEFVGLSDQDKHSSKEIELQPRRSSARRKSKPRKSS